MNMSFLSDMRRALIDSELADHDGVARWVESVSYGGVVDCTFNGLHYAAAMKARPAYLATQPRFRITDLPGLRLVKAPAKSEAA